MPTRVIITGARDWYCPELCDLVVSRLAWKYPDLAITVGDCPSGVDKSIAKSCKARGIDHDVFEARWSVFGNAAGPIRNEEMVNYGAASCVAIHRDILASKGTLDCVRQAMKSGIACYLVSDLTGDPRRIKSI